MRHILLGIMALALGFFIACGSDGGGSEEQTDDPRHQSEDSGQEQQMESNKEWIRAEPVDVKVLDLNQDGYVYQDPMDWNVIADEEGRCPKCGMFLVKVTIDEAVKNLQDNGYAVK